jgi:putative DNA methylase
MCTRPAVPRQRAVRGSQRLLLCVVGRCLSTVQPDLCSTILVPKAQVLIAEPARQGSWEAAAAFFEEAFVKPSRTCSLFTTRFRSRFLRVRSSTTSSGRWEMLPRVSCLTLPPSRQERRSRWVTYGRGRTDSVTTPDSARTARSRTTRGTEAEQPRVLRELPTSGPPRWPHG